MRKISEEKCNSWTNLYDDRWWINSLPHDLEFDAAVKEDGLWPLKYLCEIAGHFVLSTAWKKTLFITMPIIITPHRLKVIIVYAILFSMFFIVHLKLFCEKVMMFMMHTASNWWRWFWRECQVYWWERASYHFQGILGSKVGRSKWGWQDCKYSITSLFGRNGEPCGMNGASSSF